MSLAFGTILLLFVITIGDFYNAVQTNRPPDKDVINLLSWLPVLLVCRGFISGGNAVTKQSTNENQKGAWYDKYKNEECPFVYRIEAVTKIVDGDTVDCVFDLGFDVMFKSRVRLLGIDTPESRTRHKNEKVYGLLSKESKKMGPLGN